MSTTKQKKNKVNVSINGIEVKALEYLQKMRIEKENILYNNNKVKEALKDYIFGSGENPFSQITEKYNQRMEDLRERASKVAKAEKKEYLGKSKKGVKSVKKIALEVSKEVEV